MNTTSDISTLLHVISRAVRRVNFETILKYHEWYLCQISHETDRDALRGTLLINLTKQFNLNSSSNLWFISEADNKAGMKTKGTAIKLKLSTSRIVRTIFLSTQSIEGRSVTSRYHGSTISGWQQNQRRRRRQGERQKIICLY